jgi:hypothetical protein
MPQRRLCCDVIAPAQLLSAVGNNVVCIREATARSVIPFNFRAIKIEVNYFLET